MNEGRADELFIRGQKLELAMHEREELFFEGCLAQTGIFADGSNGLIHFLLEEMQGDVFLGPEIIKDGAFGNPRLARNGLGCRSVKAPGLKERQRGRHDEIRRQPEAARRSVQPELCRERTGRHADTSQHERRFSGNDRRSRHHH